MPEAINDVLRLYEDKFNSDGYSSINHLSKGFLTESQLLSPAVTHLYYKNGSTKFPLSFLTEGMGNFTSISSADISYKTPIMGRIKRTSLIGSSIYAATDKPGINGTEFEIPFADKWFKANQTLYGNQGKTQVHVKRDPVKRGNLYYYSVTLVTSRKSDYCSPSFLASGTKWAGGIVKVGIQNSRGTEHRSQSPGMMTNQLSVVRDTFKIKGNIENKIMVIEIPTHEGIKKYWSEFEYYLKNLEWKESCEDDLWYSKYNKTEDGEIITVDELAGDEVVPSGAGLIEQIPNEDSYSSMTTEKLTSIARNAFYNSSDSEMKNIEVFTGLGGLEEVDKAMKEGARNFTLVDSKFVQGNGDNMVYGAYFKSYKHVDGHMLTFRHLPLLDKGRVAEISDVHPDTGLPLESYSMYFVDMSTYEGESNVMYVSEDGRENIEFVVPGAKVPKGYDETVFRATATDGSSIETMKSQGIAVKRPTNCFKVYCEFS
jgi:hypothetical protein